jgi:hypothetical protein
LSKKTALFLEVVRKYMHFAMKTAIFLEVVRNRCTLSKKIALFLAVWWYSRHHHRQIRQPALLSKLRSSAQGLLRLLSATAAKSILEVKPSNKRGAHHFVAFPRYLDEKSSHFFAKVPGTCMNISSF